jgi:dihydrofolate reductase
LSVRISIIVAAAENGVIGVGGGLPWRMSSDLKTFRRLTMGKPIIMGRKTFQTLKKPLDGRDNIVVSRDPNFAPLGATVVDSLTDAITLGQMLALSKGEEEILIIGGAEIYRAALPRASRIYLTRVHAAPEGDVFFAPLEPADWVEVSSEPLPKTDRDEFAATLVVLDRKV